MRSSDPFRPALLVLALALAACPTRMAGQDPAGTTIQGPFPGTTESVALDARLSPNGRLVAFRIMDGVTPRLFVRRVSDPPATAFDPISRSTGVGSYSWAPDGRHLVFRAKDDGRLYLVAPEAGEGEGPRTLVPATEGPTRLAGFATDPVAALIEVPGRWPGAPDLVRVDLHDGSTARVAENDGSVHRWVPGPPGAPPLAIRLGEDGDTELIRQRGDVFLPIYRCADRELCEPSGFHPDGRVWIRSSRDRDAPALLLLDPVALEVKTIREDLSEDPEAAFRSDSTFRSEVAHLRETLGEAELGLHPPQAGGSRMLVTARSPEGSSVHLYDRWSGDVTRILDLAHDPDRSTATSILSPAPDPDLLRPGRLGYRIMEDDPGTSPVEVVRTIERRSEPGRDVWRIVDVAEVPTFEAPALDFDAIPDDPDEDPFAEMAYPGGTTRASDTVVVDAGTLMPLRRRAVGPFSMRLDFREGSVVGVVESDGFSIPVGFETGGPIWSDDAALELLVASLPLGEGYATRFVLFDAQALEPATVDLTVLAPDRVTTEAGTFQVWRLGLVSDLDDDARTEWLVRAEAPHYLVHATIRAGTLRRTIELTDAGGLR